MNISKQRLEKIYSNSFLLRDSLQTKVSAPLAITCCDRQDNQDSLDPTRGKRQEARGNVTTTGEESKPGCLALQCRLV